MGSRFAFSVFVFDAETADLTRNGRELRLPDQTSRVLAVLLERAGNLVTREELQQLIWPHGEFLDRDNAMNKAIYQLRTILRDDPKSPHFIETIPKRGYRFRSEVTVLPFAPPKLLRNRPLPPEHLAGPPFPEAVPLPGSPPPTVSEKNDLNSLVSQEEQFGPSRYRGMAQIVRSVPWKYRWILAFSAALLCFLVFRLVDLRKPQVVHVQHLSMGIAPFEVQGAGAQQLAESFRLDLADAMSELPEVQVRAARSLANQRLDDASIPELSRTLHLDVLLLGKFTLRGKICVLQLELVRGSDATHLASFEYSGSEDELTTIRDKVQHDVFTRLELTGSTTGENTGSTQNPQAYKSYLMARDSASLRTPQSLNEALQQYQDAITRDPAFAKAYAGMATAYLAISNQDSAVPVSANLQKAAEQATKALQLDPMLAEAHAVLGNVSLDQSWNLLLGEKELRRAIELDPHQAVYHLWLAMVLTDEGHFDEGFAQIDLARAEDPLWPTLYGDESFIAGCAHQNARAIAAAQKFVELAPDVPYAHSDLAWALFLSGRDEDAIAQWRYVASMEKNADWMALEDQGLKAFRQGGVSAYARVRLNAIESGIKADQENDFVPAEWYAYTGNRDKAMALLEDMLHRHDPGVIDLAVNPMYDSLHHDPRFLALLTQIGLTLPASPTAPALQASLH